MNPISNSANSNFFKPAIPQPKPVQQVSDETGANAKDTQSTAPNLIKEQSQARERERKQILAAKVLKGITSLGGKIGGGMIEAIPAAGGESSTPVPGDDLKEEDRKSVNEGIVNGEENAQLMDKKANDSSLNQPPTDDEENAASIREKRQIRDSFTQGTSAPIPIKKPDPVVTTNNQPG
jgi:hypothetical protein